MFWGLIMEPQKRYSQVVKKSFHVSMASLDICSCTDEPVQVMCGYENRKYLLCTLQNGKILQCALDLNFDTGDEVSFVTNGASHVHLSGYLNDDPMDDLNDLEEEEIEELPDISNSNIVSGKRKKKTVTEPLLNGFTSHINKQLDAFAKNGSTLAKKSKTAKLLEAIDSQNDDDSDDSDVSFSELIETEDEDVSMIEEDDDNEEEAEDEEDDDSGEEEEEDESDASEDEEESTDEEEKKPEMNGIAKKGNGTPKPKQEINKKDKAKPVKEDKKQPSPLKKRLEGGVMVEDLRVGSGTVAKPGKMVQVYYEGRFKNNNKMFDSSTKGNGFKFRLGRQEVIKGWDIGVAGMKVGGKRKIICPPNMAYGKSGSPPTIPPNSTLVFEVELKNVN